MKRIFLISIALSAIAFGVSYGADTSSAMSPESMFSCAEKVWCMRDQGKMNGVAAVRMCDDLIAQNPKLSKTDDGRKLLAKIHLLLGEIYSKGEGGVNKDDTKATQNLIEAATLGEVDVAWAAVNLASHAGLVDCTTKCAIIAAQKSEAKQKVEAAATIARNDAKAGEVREIVLPGGAKIQMIYCPPGEFIMGSPMGEDGRDADEVQHRVCLTKGFWLGKFEVTQEQWRSVMGRNPAHFRGDEKRPVERVSWEDCQRFVKKINEMYDCGARLPTEAEWEYACRAGTTTAYSWGNSLNGDKANCNGDFPCGTAARGPYFRGTTTVGRYSPNPWGFYDMHGNVYEWCEDRCADYPSEGDATDPVGPPTGCCRVLRSGCWNYGARFCRSANRIRNTPTTASHREGMRLCCDRIPK